MKRTRLSLLVALMLSVFCFTFDKAWSGQPSGEKAKSQAIARYGQIPLSFIPNHGQCDPSIKYYVDGHGHKTFFTGYGIYSVFTQRKERPGYDIGPRSLEEERYLPVETSIVKLTPLGMKSTVDISAQSLQAGKINYFIGTDPVKWKKNVPTYGKVVYRQAYRGIDLDFHGSGQRLEYDVVVQPGADPSKAKFEYSGIEALEISGTGDLSIKVKEGLSFVQKKPIVYQVIGGRRIEREGSFKLQPQAQPSSTSPQGSLRQDGPRSYIYSFEIPSYDKKHPLVIDPVLVYSTYLGSTGEDYSMSISVDSSNNAYIAGYTWSTSSFASTRIQSVLGAGAYLAYVKKLNAAGSTVLSTMYLGGTDGDSYGLGLALDTSGNAYVTGYTLASDFPITSNGFQSIKHAYSDAFVTKINAGLSSRVYSTYLGGNGNDIGQGIAVNSAGNAYVTGETSSTDFPMRSAFLATYRGGATDAFVTKLDPDGEALAYSTYLGGSGGDAGYAIAVDSSGSAYVTGSTFSANFPKTSDGYQLAPEANNDAFVTKLNPAGSALSYSTYLGGSGSDYGQDIALQSCGAGCTDVFVTGDTTSGDFPHTTGAYQPVKKQGTDAFITQLQLDAAPTLVYSSFFGGDGADYGRGITVDSSGNAYVTGWTSSDSTTFPVTSNAFQLAKDKYGAAFVAKLLSGGSSLSYCSYYIGEKDNGNDFAKAIALDTSFNAYITGYTELSGTRRAFVAKINDTAAAASITVTSPNGSEVWQAGTSKTVTWSYTGSPGASVLIELLEANALVGIISSGTSIGSHGVGSFSWNIPASQTTGGDFKIRIISTTDTSKTDDSDGDFTIGAPIGITSPSGGETWAAGASKTIRWTYAGSPGANVKIELLKAGALQSTLTAGTSIGSGGAGSYTWAIPSGQAPGSDYKVRVTSTTDSSYTGTSNSNFTIARGITVTSPNGGERWAAGATKTIGWTYAGSPGSNVKIELLKAGALQSTLTAGTSTGSGGSGSYVWPIPSEQAIGSSYTIRVTSTTDSAYTDISDGNFTIANGEIALTSPNGGETWATGTSKTISWTYAGATGSNVKIELLKTGVLQSTLAAGTSIGSGGIGSYAWPIPPGQALGVDYKIRVTDTTNSAITNTSNANFTIAQGIKIISPNGGEIWTTGTSRTISWTYAGTPGSNVKVELLKAGALHSTLAAVTSTGSGGSGSYAWTIPSGQALDGDYKIRVTSTTDSAYTDTSNSNFTIAQAGMTVTSPAGGEIWATGTSKTISWIYAGSPVSNVKIELLKAGALQSTLAASTSTSANGAGSYAWTIPSGQTLGVDYKIRVTSTTDSTYTDISNSNFTIAQGEIAVTSPKGGEKWAAGVSGTISWTYVGSPGSNVKVELLKAGALQSTLTAGTSTGSGGAGSYVWAIPSGQTPDTDYAIRVTSTTNSAIMDTSNSNFTITVPAPVADFSGTPTSGLIPLTVNFTDASTGTITSRSWDFGDGGTSTQQNPSHTYSVRGAYNVTLVATGPGGSNTKVKSSYIAAQSLVLTTPNGGGAWHRSATGTISWLYSGTPGSSLRIELIKGNPESPTSTTIIASAAPVGSGGKGSHTWTVPEDQVIGSGYRVRITSTTNSAYTDLSNGTFSILDAAPVADFTGTPTSGQAPLPVQFSDTSTGNVTSWAWDFGDAGSAGNTSKLQNPSHTYLKPGTYTVSLTATGPGGWRKKVLSNYINVPPAADFTASPLTGQAPLLVQFTDQSSSGTTAWSWDFGDGTPVRTAKSPQHTYSAPGSYTVTLTATGAGGSDTKVRTGYINVPPAADFSATPTSGYAPLAVSFTDASTGSNTSWAWDFGDGAGSTIRSPSHTYNAPGAYTVTMTVTGPGGSDTKTRTDYINVRPTADFSGTPTSGYAPLAVSFTDASTGANTSWDWDFGDGSGSTTRNPSHTYTSPGAYTVSLTVTGPGGTDTKTKTSYIRVRPTADFSGTPTGGSAPLPVSFTDSSTGTNTSWAWDFGDGSNGTGQTATHSYTRSGKFTVALTVTGPGGSDTKTRANYVTVAPVADFSAAPTSGLAPKSVVFTDQTTQGVTSWLWDFGDSGTSTSQNPSHTYTDVGVYTVTLTSSGPGGSDSKTRSSYITMLTPIGVTAPNGGDTWDAGIQKTIQWAYSGSNPGTSIKIELVKAGAVVGVIVAGTPIGTAGAGSYNWTIPATQTPGSDYKVKITSLANSTYVDSSDSTFTINPPAIAITSPNGGEAWYGGNTQMINWTYTGDPGPNVKIELFKAGALDTVLSSSTSTGSGGAGSLAWTIPVSQAAGADYKIRITSTTYPGVVDNSNANFTITPTTLTLTAPTTGGTWNGGSVLGISWNYTGAPGNVKIELLKAGVLDTTISAGTSVGSGGTGSFSWTIPADQAAGADYKIRISSASLPAVTDISDNYFTITPSTLAITSPNGGENWIGGDLQTISWAYTGAPGNVKIELLKAGLLDTTISAGASVGSGGTGSLSWTVPADQAEGADYKIKISSISLSSVTDTSANYFTITPTALTITSPNTNVTWIGGTAHTITWTYTGSPGDVKIELLKAGVPDTTISAGASVGSGGAGSFSWTVPVTQAAGTSYKIRISSLTVPTATDSSNSNFTISLATLTLTVPNASGIVWNRGTTRQITWTFTGDPGNLKIELLKGGSPDTKYPIVVSSTPASTGSYSWAILSDANTGTTFKIRITSTLNSAITRTSGTNFKIQ